MLEVSAQRVRGDAGIGTPTGPPRLTLASALSYQVGHLEKRDTVSHGFPSALKIASLKTKAVKAHPTINHSFAQGSTFRGWGLTLVLFNLCIRK